MNQSRICYQQYINSENYEAETEAFLEDLYIALDEAEGKMAHMDFMALEDAVSSACSKIEKRAFSVGFSFAIRFCADMVKDEDKNGI